MRTDRSIVSSHRKLSALRALGSALIVLGGCAEGGGDPDETVVVGERDAENPGVEEDTNSERDAQGGGGMPSGNGGGPGMGAEPTVAPGDKSGSAGLPTGPVCSDIDWSKVGAVAQSSADNLRALRATQTKDCLYVSVEYERGDAGYGLLLDTDGSASTGFQTRHWTEHSGAEYMLQKSYLYRHDPADASAWKSKNATPLEPLSKVGSMEFRIPLGAIGTPTSVRLGFMLLSATGEMSGKIPNTSAFATVSAVLATGGSPATPADPGAKPVSPPDRSSCRAAATKTALNTGAKIPIGKGMLVPAYLSTADIRQDVWQAMADRYFPAPFDSSGVTSVKLDGFTYGLRPSELAWVNLVQEARKLSGDSLDLFIVANGANNGPPTTFEEWNAAVALWKGVQSEGGGVFGYVNTGKQASTPGFVEIDQVMAQVDTWVRNYPEIDGIFLDQFQPRSELFAAEGSKFTASAGCDANVMPPSYPNGVCNAPSDASYLRSNGCFDPAVAIEPAGGYYHTLTQRIRTEYPGLAIIGNARGRLATNQLKYGSLVDLLVSYEDSFSKAQASWAQVKPQTSSSVPEAALLHGTSSTNVRSAVERLATSGYTHVYVSDQNSNSTTNVWAKLPAYLSAEASYVVQQY